MMNACIIYPALSFEEGGPVLDAHHHLVELQPVLEAPFTGLGHALLKGKRPYSRIQPLDKHASEPYLCDAWNMRVSARPIKL